MAQGGEDIALPPPPHQTQDGTHSLHPPSPSPSEPEEYLHETSTSRTPSQRPTEEISTSASTSSPAPTLYNNPDYIALQSSLSLLNSQHRQAVDDMHTLVSLKEKALANPAWFKHLVLTGQLGDLVPKKQNVVRCPRVEWEKYGSLGTRLGRELDKPTPIEPLYTVFIFFGTWIDDRECICFHHWNIKKKGRCNVIIHARKRSGWVKGRTLEAVNKKKDRCRRSKAGLRCLLRYDDRVRKLELPLPRSIIHSAGKDGKNQRRQQCRHMWSMKTQTEMKRIN